MSYQKYMKELKTMLVYFVCGAVCGLVIVGVFGVLLAAQVG